jgi:hypothetical protein
MLFNDNKFFAVKAGNVSLKLHNHTDIFYSGEVEASEAFPDYETLVGMEKIGFDDYMLKPRSYHKVAIDSKETIIEGFYEDTMPTDVLIPYEVRVYIRYEVEENETPNTNKS